MTTFLESTHIPCPDGLTMGVDVYGPEGAETPLPVVVMCHGFKGFRKWGMFPPLAERLAEGGRAVVLFDFSHNGVGENPESFDRMDLFKVQTISRAIEDLGTVLDFLQDDALAARCHLQQEGRVNVVGHSMGGGVALLRTATDGRIAQVCSLNGVSHLQRLTDEVLAELEAEGYVTIKNVRTGQEMPLGSEWFDDLPNHDIEGAAQTIFVPSLVVQGDEDPNVKPHEGQSIADWIPAARLVMVEGGDHTFGARHPFTKWTAPLEEVARELDAFLPSLDRLGGI
ncbi:MAG: alpha/beta fold hydrolase [Planctomycetota bacterium]|nr:alpha/beta fold hydrolase [Planctomycetota bacterium]